MSRFNEHGLTPQQEKFAQKVVAGSTLSDAYRDSYRAGEMTAKQIHEESSKLGSHPKVAQRVRAMQAASAEIAILEGAQVLREVKMLAHSDIAGLVGPDGKFKLPQELDEATRAAVASFEIDKGGVIKYRFWSKTDALEKAMKHLGLYEQNNKQKADPLRELLDSLGGVVVGVSSGKSRREL